MELIGSLTPPDGTSITKLRKGDELIFPRVFGRTASVDGEEKYRTHFGLWFVDIKSGSTRAVEAPFYVDKRYYTGHLGRWVRYWIGRGLHEGSLVYSLGVHGSWDIGHHIFFFDGEHWDQAVRQDGGVMLLSIGDNHDTIRWGSPGPIRCRAILSGGNLVTGTSPLRIAVDNTHAFAYDSGPDSPESAEFIAINEENRLKGSSGSALDEAWSSPSPDTLRLLPEEYRAEDADKRWRFREFEIDSCRCVSVFSYSSRELTKLLLLGP